SLARATHDGHRLALVLLVFAVVGAALMWAQTRLETSVSVPPAIRRAYVAALVVALAAVLSVVVARYGSPQAIARKAWNQLSNPVAQMHGTNLNSRLFSLSWRREIVWHHAWHDARAHPVSGARAGWSGLAHLRQRACGVRVR